MYHISSTTYGTLTDATLTHTSQDKHTSTSCSTWWWDKELQINVYLLCKHISYEYSEVVHSRCQTKWTGVKWSTAVDSWASIDTTELQYDSVAAGANENVLSQTTSHHQWRVYIQSGMSLPILHEEYNPHTCCPDSHSKCNQTSVSFTANQLEINLVYSYL